MNKHYDKYKETIKKVARRHRLLKDKWIADYLMSNSLFTFVYSFIQMIESLSKTQKIKLKFRVYIK